MSADSAGPYAPKTLAKTLAVVGGASTVASTDAVLRACDSYCDKNGLLNGNAFGLPDGAELQLLDGHQLVGLLDGDELGPIDCNELLDGDGGELGLIDCNGLLDRNGDEPWLFDGDELLFWFAAEGGGKSCCDRRMSHYPVTRSSNNLPGP